jgi:hypothetical protein
MQPYLAYILMIRTEQPYKTHILMVSYELIFRRSLLGKKRKRRPSPSVRLEINISDSTVFRIFIKFRTEVTYRKSRKHKSHENRLGDKPHFTQGSN